MNRRCDEARLPGSRTDVRLPFAEARRAKPGADGRASRSWEKACVRESFPAHVFETADVSLGEGTIAGCNYSFFFTSPRNRSGGRRFDPVHRSGFFRCTAARKRLRGKRFSFRRRSLGLVCSSRADAENESVGGYEPARRRLLPSLLPSQCRDTQATGA